MSIGRLGAGDTAIQPTIFDAKADLLTATAADTPARLAVGTNGQVLTADSSEATGLKFATPTSGGMTLLSTTALTGSSVALTDISQSYVHLQLIIYLANFSNDNSSTYMRFNNDSGANRYAAINSLATTVAFTRTNIYTDPGSDNGTSTALTIIDIPYYTGASWKMANIEPICMDPTTATSVRYETILGVYNQTTAISEINLLTSAGTWDSGTAYLYGVK